MNLSGLGYPDQQRVPVGWQWPKGIKQLERPRWPQSERLYQLAQAVPTLDLPFAATRSLVDNISGRNLITFTRASSATFIDSTGTLQTATTNVPPFDHNPITGESLGLRVEEQRTNLRTYSDAILIANGYNVTNSILTTVSIANPFSGTTASLFTLNVGANAGNTSDGFNYGSGLTLINSTQYTQSLFVKPASATVLRLRSNTSGLLADFTLTGNGTAPSLSAELQGASIVPFPNGWYRVSWTFTTTTSAPGNRGDYWAIKTNVADGTNGVYVVGAQLEAGAFPTSYIPTTTAATTRAADVASITGSAFSSWYRQDEGTVFSEFGPYGNGGALKNPAIVQIDSGSAANTIRMFCGSTLSPVFAVATSSVTQAYISSGTLLIPSATSKITGAYKVNDFARAANGSTLGTGSSGTVPTLSQMLIGTGNAGISELCGTIRRITYFPARLPNTALQRMTQ
jgi:hypothetical protein